MPFITQTRRVVAVWRTCRTCRKRFLVAISDTKRGVGKYCSPTCYHKGKGPNIGTFKKGNHPPTEFKRGHPKPKNAYVFPPGDQHPNWKGNKAGYGAFHYRVHEKLGSATKCEVCKTTKAPRYNWANLTGKYHDITDYKQMCAKCHKNFDLARINRHRSTQMKCSPKSDLKPPTR